MKTRTKTTDFLFLFDRLLRDALLLADSIRASGEAKFGLFRQVTDLLA